MNEHLRILQVSLKNLGHDPGPLDGLWGRRTRAAMQSLIENSGQPLASLPNGNGIPDLPWISEAMTMWGMHEVNDKAVLSEYLRSNGRTLGDPSALPWCGDFIHTVTQNALPDEPWPQNALHENPYWARNWMLFGKSCPAVFGAYAIFSRGNGGHIGILVGELIDNYYVLGGNQSDSVNVVKIAKRRLLGTRWPLSYPQYNSALQSTVPMAQIEGHAFQVSTNEA